MARPTSDPKISKVILRINEETRQRIEESAELAGVSISEYIRNVLNKQNTGLPSNIPNNIISDFDAILTLSDTDFESFFKALYKKVENGEVDIDEVMK